MSYFAESWEYNPDNERLRASIIKFIVGISEYEKQYPKMKTEDVMKALKTILENTK